VQLARQPDGFLAIMAEQRLARQAKRDARRVAKLASLAPAMVAEIESFVEVEDAAVVAETERHERELLTSGALRASADDTDSTADAALLVRGLHTGYGEVEVLHGVDLNIRRGQITALLGANGSGKSTLCSTISGLVAVRQGSIELAGQEISRVPAHRRARMGVLVAPEARGIFPGLTVEENLILRLNPDERRQVYERFPVLGERRRLPAGSLSGGEQQMLTLGAVLARPPAVLIADEPTLGLAPLIILQLLEVFKQLRDAGTAVLLVEEKVRDVLKIADRVAFLELGHIVWSGQRSDIDDEQMIAAYLGSATSST
jgi:ABC-type branched-subunit amino acid transport system ATPase component